MWTRGVLEASSKGEEAVYEGVGVGVRLTLSLASLALYGGEGGRCREIDRDR